jgi:hypothetical protein
MRWTHTVQALVSAHFLTNSLKNRDESQHRPDLRKLSKCRKETHFRGAGISETHLDSCGGKRAHQALGTSDGF